MFTLKNEFNSLFYTQKKKNSSKVPAQWIYQTDVLIWLSANGIAWK